MLEQKGSIFALLMVLLLVVVKNNYFPEEEIVRAKRPSKAKPSEEVVDVFDDGLEQVRVTDKKTGEQYDVFRKPFDKKYRSRNVKFVKDRVSSPDFETMDDYDAYQDRIK